MSRRSFSGHHDLLPAAEERGTVIVSIISAHTLFVWTFGSGTVFWRIWPAVLMHTLFATGVTIISMRSNIYLGIPNVMLTVLGVVIGFVISYRASSGYDRYWMGRTMWTDLMKNSRALSRLIWFHVPLRLTPKSSEEIASAAPVKRPQEEVHAIMKEKRAALDLIEGFAIAVKHHLRGEMGIYYEDLYPFTRPLHTHPHHSHHHSESSIVPVDSSTAVASVISPTFNALLTPPDPVIPTINSYGSLTPFGPSTRPRLHASRGSSRSSLSERTALLPSSRAARPGIWSQVSGDLIPFANYFKGLFSFYRPVALDEDGGVDDAGAAGGSGADGDGEEGGVQRQWGGDSAHQHPKDRKHRPRVAGNGENIPLEVLRTLSDWLSVLEDRGTVPGTSLGAMVGLIAAFEDSLSGLERILTTPLPFVYSVHISTVWIYLFFLPLQLVDLFAWYTIPGVAIASFIYLGFLAAGEEIEQPFGYDENDLDLDMFCKDIVHADIERLKRTPGANVFLGAHHEKEDVKVSKQSRRRL